MSERYTHRNGETEPPTERGWFWYAGAINFPEMQALTWRGLVYFVYSEGSSVLRPHVSHSALAIVREVETGGRWWGPLTLPWEIDNDR
jgi:hypothetical protein